MPVSLPVQLGSESVRALPSYQGGKPIAEVAREFGLNEANIIKLASNENPLGVPESAKQAMLAVVGELSRYPDANGFELKRIITTKYDVPQDWIVLGNGSGDILGFAAQAFVQPGQAALFSEYSFAMYALAAQIVGGRNIVVPAKNLGHDLDAMAAAITADTKLIFIANPNNPTGTFLPAADLEAFLNKVPKNVVVVLDEAYKEFLAPELQYDATAWVRTYPNLLILRTMSKAYGLAGLRVGFGIAQPGITELLNRVRPPFNVNSVAQAAAIAAMNDTAFIQRVTTLNAEGYQQLSKAFIAMDLEFVPSHANFVLVKVGADSHAAARINLALLKKGIIVRPVANYGLPHYLRVSIGLPSENATFLSALKEILDRV